VKSINQKHYKAEYNTTVLFVKYSLQINKISWILREMMNDESFLKSHYTERSILLLKSCKNEFERVLDMLNELCIEFSDFPELKPKVKQIQWDEKSEVEKHIVEKQEVRWKEENEKEKNEKEKNEKEKKKEEKENEENKKEEKKEEMGKEEKENGENQQDEKKQIKEKKEEEKKKADLKEIRKVEKKEENIQQDFKKLIFLENTAKNLIVACERNDRKLHQKIIKYSFIPLFTALLSSELPKDKHIWNLILLELETNSSNEIKECIQETINIVDKIKAGVPPEHVPQLSFATFVIICIK